MGTDKYYIERCLNGHPDDFRYLVRRYQAILLAHLAGRLGNKDWAQESAQEVFVRAYFGLGKLKKRGSFFSWLLGMADRMVKEQQRNERKRRQIANSFSARPPCQQPRQDYALEQAIAKLAEKYRTVILLRYYGGYSCNQVAEQLDMPLGTVTKTLSRAYAVLRESLCQQGGNYEVQK